MTTLTPSAEPFKNEYESLDDAGQVVSVIATPEAKIIIEVVAPSNVPEGYILEVESSGQRFAVVVPPGGVLQGQPFTAPGQAIMRDMNHGPVGAWKDGLCDCFKYGICHAHLWLACCCRSIALAQVMVRMRLNWCGEAASVSAAAKTFKTVCFITFTYLALDYALSLASNMLYGKYINDLTLSGYAQDYTGMEDYFEQDENTNTADAPVGFYIMTYLRQIMGYAFMFYFWIAAFRTRRAIRERHAIPEQNCVGCEDVVCVVCCGCCTVMQMSRHTADYDKYPSQCCTETGLPSHVDAVVP